MANDNGSEIRGNTFIPKQKPTLMEVFNILPGDTYVEINSCRNVITKGKIPDIMEMYNDLCPATNEDDISPALKKKVRHIVPCLSESSNTHADPKVEKFQIQLEEVPK